MADNQLSKGLGAIRLTSAFQTVYTADSTGDGKQATGQLIVTPLDGNNIVYVDVSKTVGGVSFPVVENMGLARGQAEVIPVAVADGQALKARVRSDLTQLTISGVTQANPGVITVNSTVGLKQNADNLVYIASVGGMVEITDGLYRITYLTSTTVSLQDADGNDINTTAYTAYTSGGTIDIIPATVIFDAFEENIPQV